MHTGTSRTSASAVLFVLVAVLGALAGCGTANKESSFNSDTGRHPAGWSAPASHGSTAKSQAGGFPVCQECHGSDFSGGISAISCFSCHGVSAPHAPAPWRGTPYTHTNTDPENAVVCAQCHLGGANSSVQPSPPAPQGTPPGCFNNTLCHATPGHPAGWSDPAQHGAAAKAAPSASGGFALCENCHGSDFTGGTALTSCFTCHGVSAPHAPAPWRMPTSAYTHTTTDPANAVVCAQCHTNGANSSVQPSPPAPQGTAPGCFNNTLCHATPTCGTCHALPPDGSSFPNTAGSHSVHMAVNTSIACGTCHQGAGSGTVLHQNGVADVLFDTAYNAKTGAASYNSGTFTCSNVSCHGGQTTPNWLTGTINVNTQCTSCHSSGTTQYNSYNSGRHSDHAGFACTECHDTTKLSSVHFLDLNTQAMTNAYRTIQSFINYTGTAGTFGTCTMTCHGETHTGRLW